MRALTTEDTPLLKLYCAPFTVSTAAVVALNEAGLHWEAIRVDIKGGEQTREAYLAINPKGRVPVLLTPEGPLTELGAILEYLAETAMPGYVPADPLARARMREVMYYLASTMHVNHAHRLRGRRWANEEASLADMAAKVPETMAASCAYIESVITGPFLFGPDLTLADFYLYTVTTWLPSDNVDITAFPKLAAFAAAMEETRGVRRARADGFFG